MIIIIAHHQFQESKYPIINCSNIYLPWKGQATLMSPSGSGKTTFFRVLSGWYSENHHTQCQYSNDIDIFKGIRFIGGHRSLLPWKTVYGNFRLHFPRKKKALFYQYLEELDLNHNVSKLYPYELSVGMYKRIELILAVMSNPNLLLLDEYYTSIDDDRKDLVQCFLNKHRGTKLTWVTVHENNLRDWISGKSFHFTFADNGYTVTGIVEA
ncbi:MAG: ATP-binding cassette domain-containing protein [Desulfobacterales bacterium]|nr:ATP-binding cassette domain-containing protein [Desulfobacterales bacterium]